MIHADLYDLYQRRAALAFALDHGRRNDTASRATLAAYEAVQRAIDVIRRQPPHQQEESADAHAVGS